jgi:hypothetical protein
MFANNKLILAILFEKNPDNLKCKKGRAMMGWAGGRLSLGLFRFLGLWAELHEFNHS